MKIFSFFLLSILFSHSIYAQTFTGGGGAIQDGLGTTTPIAGPELCVPVTVTGVGNINYTYGLSQVCITLTHTFTPDLIVYLKSPDGTKIPLTIFNGDQSGTLVNYTNTCFAMNAATSISAVTNTNPYTGTYRPDGHLGWFNNGQNANGVWSLCVIDYFQQDIGNLVSFNITFSATPAQAPVTGCNGNPPAANQCNFSTPICNLNGYCGNTSSAYSANTWTELDNAFCGSIENNSFISFVASATTVSLSVLVTNSLNAQGIQMMVYSGGCGSGAVTSFGCVNQILPSATPTVFTANGLTVGNTYYLMVDGFAGDVCDYSIVVNSGVNVLNVTPAAPTICNGNNTNLTATGGNGTYNWSPATGLNTTVGAVVLASPTVTTTYTVTSGAIGSLNCPLSKQVTVTVNPLPPTPTASVSAQPTCPVPTGTVTVTAPLGANFTYSLDYTTYQANPVFTGVGVGSYNVSVKNTTTGCVSAGVLVTINPPPVAPAAPTATVTLQPTCVAPTGTITITAPTGPTLEYSINGTTYQPGLVFTGLAAGNYNVTVRDNATNCVSTATPLVVNAAPGAPPAPTATVTAQPNCTVPTGTITITAPIGANLEYSINGTTYQPGLVFAGLAPANYSVTVRNTTTGCVSVATVLIVNAAPIPPAAPTASVTVQPTCTVPFGTIVITAPVGANLEYSVNGTTYQPGSTFTNLNAAVYNVTVRNTITGCISTATVLTVDPPPGAPAAPTATVTTQPTCATPTGTITITAPIGATLEYSINGTTYQTALVFTGLTPGNYNVTVRNTATGCVSSATALTVDPISGIPAAPSASATVQPTCAVPTGTITITAPLGAGLEYSINGTTYQPGIVFVGLAPANYNVTVRNTANGCVSNATIITINPVPTPPATPTASVTTQPTCTIATGTITVTAPVGAGLEYSINGIAYQPGLVFTGLAPGNYNVTVRNTISGCVSAITALTVNAIPPPLATPTANVTVQPNCIISTGTILVSAPVGANIEYNLNGGPFQTSPTFTTLAPGNYAITARNTATNCVSPIRNITVSNVPAKSADPLVLSPVDYCLNAIATPLSANGNLLLWYTQPAGGIPALIPPTPSTANTGTVTYYVTQTNLPNCESNRVPIIVNVNDLPAANAGPDKQVALGQSVTLNGTASGNNVTYIWTPILVTNTLTPSVSPVVQTTYTLTVTSDKGCTASDDVTVKVIKEVEIPNTFSPNGDGINDKWNLKNIDQYPNCSIEIFNRYGQQIFKSTGYTKQWDGTYNGSPLPVATYYYIIGFGVPNRDVIKGSITIIR